jgi:EAL domain-containing protein (putative c-di-GMP-specific phosphodiesterase class I)
MQVVAEGIETPAQFELLAEMGADYAQGFLIARPMFDDEVAAYLARVPSHASAPVHNCLKQQRRYA